MDRFHELPFSKKSFPKIVIVSYVLDYVILILLFIAFWALDIIEPFHQHFSLRNYTLQYPYAVHERVPIALLFFVAVACPAFIIAIYTLFIDGIFSHRGKSERSRNGRTLLGRRDGRTLKDRLWELNCGLLGLILASSSAFVITGALKNATGKPRPDLIARCLPLAGSADPLVFGLSNSTICTQTNHAILKDGFRSFPSGHSSSAFGGLFYLSLYLAGKLHVLDQRGQVWKCFVVLTPSLGAALVAISRIMDARHHPFDVITGSLLGILTAFCAYRQYFPPVSEAWRKGRAYPIRSWGTEPIGPAHDEREIARDQGAEPLRMPDIHTDEEEHSTSAFTAVTHETPELGRTAEPRPNVFQQHLSEEEERRRQQDPGTRRTAPWSKYSTESELRNPPNPFATSSSQRGHRRLSHNDGYSSSISSGHVDEEEDGFEMQPREPEPGYTLTDPQPQARAISHVHTAYNPHIYTEDSTA